MKQLAYELDEREAAANYYRKNFYDFLKYDGRHYWIHGQHLQLLAQKLQEVAAGKVKKLIITLPPRHGKSELISKKFPAWYLLNNPDKEIIISSYAAELSYDFSRVARQTFRDYQHVFGVEIASDNQAVQKWGIEGHRGGLVAAGVGGAITGRGYHVGIIDDPLKNREEANSETMRKKIWEWYQAVFRTRAYPDASMVIVMTRWHEDDLVGRLLKEQSEEWEVINFPALAEKKDELKREEGEPLWPARYSSKELASIRKDIGTYEWLSLYQERPSGLDGNIFKREWFHYIDRAPQDLRIYQTIDLAATKKTESDYFALLTFGHDSDYNLYLLDLYAGHLDFPVQIRIIQSYYDKWKPLSVGVETVAYQHAMEQWLRNKTNIPVRKLRPSTDKVTRALRVTPHFENGKVFIVRGLPFQGLLEEQLLQFPNGKHDDIVDVVSYMVDMFSSGNYATIARKSCYN